MIQMLSNITLITMSIVNISLAEEENVTNVFIKLLVDFFCATAWCNIKAIEDLKT